MTQRSLYGLPQKSTKVTHNISVCDIMGDELR